MFLEMVADLFTDLASPSMGAQRNSSLGPDQIRNRKFATVRRGYDQQQVQACLEKLATRVEGLRGGGVESQERAAAIASSLRASHVGESSDTQEDSAEFWKHLAVACAVILGIA